MSFPAFPFRRPARRAGRHGDRKTPKTGPWRTRRWVGGLPPLRWPVVLRWLAMVCAAVLSSAALSSVRVSTETGADGQAASLAVRAGRTGPDTLRVGDYESSASEFDDAALPGVRLGLAPTLVHAIAGRDGAAVVHRRFASRDAALAALVARHIDLVALPCFQAQHDRRLWVSEPYVTQLAGAVVKKGGWRPHELADLSRRRIVLERGDSGSVAHNWVPAAERLYVGDARAALEMVADGGADAFVDLHASNAALVGAGGYGSLAAVPLPLAVPFCFAAGATDAATASMIEQGLAQLPPPRRREMQWPLARAVPRTAGEPFALTDDERRWAQTHRVVRVGMERLHRPYDFIDDRGQWRGLGATLLKRFASVAHIDFKPVLIGDAHTLDDALRDGTIDLAASFPIGGTPRPGIALARAYESIPWVLVSRRDAPAAASRIAANAWRLRRVEPAPGLGGLTIVPRERAADALRAMVAGNADGAFVNASMAEELLERYDDGGLRVDTTVVGIERIGFAAAAHHAPLAAMLDRYLASYTRQELERLASGSRPVSVLLGYEKRTVNAFAIGASAIVAAVLCTLLATYWRTRAARRAAEAARLEAVASRERAEAADRAKSAFVAMMSHEIRTPMNGIIGVLDLFDAMQLTRQQRRLLDVAQRSGRLMLRVIDGTLDYLKMEQGALTLEARPFDLDGLAAAVVELHAPLANRKGLQLLYAAMPHFDRAIVGDEARLNQILTNLLSNAIRFTQAGHVQLELKHRVVHGRHELRIVVSDTGCGIAQAYRPRLFLPFTQQDGSTTRRYGGTGLGLSIVKRLVDAMDGAIDVCSEPGAGTRVIVDLPLVWAHAVRQWPALAPMSARVRVPRSALSVSIRAVLARLAVTLAQSDDAVADVDLSLDAAGAVVVAGAHNEARGVRGVDELIDALVQASLARNVRAHERARHPAAEDEDGLSSDAGRLPQRVLVVEDNEINREIIVRQLAMMGVSASAAADGVQGYARWLRERPACVLLDCHMPRMDGYTMARRIRACEARQTGRGTAVPRTSIVAISANATADDQRACLQAGMDDYLAKPITRRKLAAVLDRCNGDADDPS